MADFDSVISSHFSVISSFRLLPHLYYYLFMLSLLAAGLSVGACIFDSGESSTKDKWQPTVRVVLESRVEADLAVAKSVVEKRLQTLDLKVKATLGGSRLVVETADISVEEARRTLGARGRLRLMEMAVGEDGRVAVTNPDGSKTSITLNRVLSDRMLIQSAVFVPLALADGGGVSTELTSQLMVPQKSGLQKSVSGLTEVVFVFNDEGAQLMRKASERLSHPPQPIAIWVDDEPLRDQNGLILAPLVQSIIDREAIVAGLSATDSHRLYAFLISGELPISVTISEAGALP